MAGYREFQTGEVLTAANVNDFLMDQSVMKFADAAARDTALGTAVGGANALREGMVAYLDSTDEVLAYNGTAWSALGNAGIGSNVVSATKLDEFTTTARTPQDIPGLSVTITPSSASSKILVILSVSGISSDTAGGGPSGFILVRDSTDIALSTASAFKNFTGHLSGRSLASTAVTFNSTSVYLDSPATTSAVTYKATGYSDAGTFYVNREGDDSAGSTSSITVIEVAA